MRAISLTSPRRTSSPARWLRSAAIRSRPRSSRARAKFPWTICLPKWRRTSSRSSTSSSRRTYRARWKRSSRRWKNSATTRFACAASMAASAQSPVRTSCLPPLPTPSSSALMCARTRARAPWRKKRTWMCASIASSITQSTM
ncbi:hypothetical protein SDC9_173435 [bioreactor metagenome]|uniref:Uncharacterized protein n=1 Tax=bioreactor metagenome TaxID=1076179 RepID=A0A645GQR1_9ZZZZ